jgi:hypothetical protein
MPATTAETAPWPIVGECYGHPAGGSCTQCDGSHPHRWKAWTGAPRVGAGTVVVGGTSGPGLPVRCVECGTRKCDAPVCAERRHHRGPHLGLDGSVREVGT